MPLPKITNFSFGSISINGRKYETDIIVFWDGEILERVRTHVFSKKELMEILVKDPELVVIGTGTAGNMKVENQAADYTKLNGIELIVKTTDKAVKDFNDMVRKKRVAAVFHISD